MSYFPFASPTPTHAKSEGLGVPESTVKNNYSRAKKKATVPDQKKEETPGLNASEKPLFDEKSVRRLLTINLEVDLADYALKSYLKDKGFGTINIPDEVRQDEYFKKLNSDFQSKSQKSKNTAKYLGKDTSNPNMMQRNSNLQEYKRRLNEEIFNRQKKEQTPGLNATVKNPETIAFNKHILRAMKKGYAPTKIFNLGKPFGQLEKHIPNYEIVMTGRVLTKSMTKDKDHQLNWANFIDLPLFLNNPTAIFKSESIGYVVLTEVKDVEKKPVMVSLHINEKFVITNIASLYVRNYETYKKWIKEGLDLYVNKKSDLFNYTQATIAVGSNKSLGKDTKKGLNNPNVPKKVNPKEKIRVTPKATPSVKKPATMDKNSLAYKMANQNKDVEYFEIPDKNIARILGKIEKKTKESVFVSLTGGEGSMKTRMAFQFMNAFAQNYKVGHASIEEHPESVLYFDKAKQYLDTKAQGNITNPEVNDVSSLHRLILKNDVIVIDSFTKMKEIEKSFEVDRDLRKKYNGKLFIVIFQQTTDGSMRGGSKSQFDADVVLFTEKFDNYKQNYVYATKNRYSEETGLKFNIYSKQLQGAKKEKSEVQKKTNKLSFKVK